MTADNKPRAAAYLLSGIFFATSQDALVKAMNAGYPTWETIMFRGIIAMALFMAWGAWNGRNLFRLPRGSSLIVWRGFLLFTSYLGFCLAIATLPLANATALYFTMPFFVGALAGPVLGEKVPAYRWIAIALGFCGVLISVRPGGESFQPSALLAIYSGFSYAIAQLIGRKVKVVVDPLVVANMQSVCYLLGSVVLGIVITALKIDASATPALAALTAEFAWPSLRDFAVMVAIGVFAMVSTVFFVRAYFSAPVNFVAPLEYSAIITATIFGITLFGDYPDFYTLLGAAIVIGAGLFMIAMDQRRAGPIQVTG
ncbi:DMT family transporter [Aestuariivirga litoralis]|uniref:DMT family transporter n=1 Tax=Aestuariivirga litoralis TaxID=2650924 RepID=UPI0018C59B31|nr:DMT family transporter [Aestuariivirga litoralis]MBG1231997.1 DMT family transporter [Aestuariivirga litoralis]